ncbi:TPA: hypothetical protein ACS3J7_005781, partial [Klebsiella oxytoca]
GRQSVTLRSANVEQAGTTRTATRLRSGQPRGWVSLKQGVEGTTGSAGESASGVQGYYRRQGILV